MIHRAFDDVQSHPSGFTIGSSLDDVEILQLIDLESCTIVDDTDENTSFESSDMYLDDFRWIGVISVFDDVETGLINSDFDFTLIGSRETDIRGDGGDKIAYLVKCADPARNFDGLCF